MMYWSSGKNSTGVLHCVLEFEMGDVATLTVVWVAIGVNVEIGSKLLVGIDNAVWVGIWLGMCIAVEVTIVVGVDIAVGMDIVVGMDIAVGVDIAVELEVAICASGWGICTD